MKLAKRMSRLGTETAFEVLAKAKALEAEGREIIHLEIGEPDFDTPANIIDAAVEALRSGHTHYTPASGVPPLREAIAEEVSKTRDISVHPDQVAVVPGGKPSMISWTSSGLRYSQPIGGSVTVPVPLSATTHGSCREPVLRSTWHSFGRRHSQSVTSVVPSGMKFTHCG